jgi:hypothetical protein
MLMMVGSTIAMSTIEAVTTKKPLPAILRTSGTRRKAYQAIDHRGYAHQQLHRRAQDVAHSGGGYLGQKYGAGDAQRHRQQQGTQGYRHRADNHGQDAVLVLSGTPDVPEYHLEEAYLLEGGQSLLEDKNNNGRQYQK